MVIVYGLFRLVKEVEISNRGMITDRYELGYRFRVSETDMRQEK